jgi:tetratricopeptide (TPR) repeat protein
MEAKELPARPNLEQYKKQAKELVKACLSGDSEALQRAKKYHPRSGKLPDAEILSAKFAFADAQFIIAREHGFESWPKFAKHIEGLTRGQSPISRFEAAADAVVAGDVVKLKSLLRENPELIRERSTRVHQATLLHYVSANGVEDFRQKTPKNAVEVAKILLKAGAEVEAVAECYGGSKTLDLVATSIHPARAGVQIALLETLLDTGAAIEGFPGKNVVNGCLANGRPEAAEFLAKGGARLDLEGAAGVGRLDLVRSFFNKDGSLKVNATRAQVEAGFLWACEFGRDGVVEFLLDKGVEAATEVHGMNGLHWAIVGGRLGTAKLLLERNVPLEWRNGYGGTALGCATWAATQSDPVYRWPDRETDWATIVQMLIAAGARVEEAGYPTGNERVDEVLRRHGAKPVGNAAKDGTRSVSDAADKLRQRALLAKREKRFEDARQDLLEAVELLRREGNRVERAQALRDLGEVERSLPDGDAARRHYAEAVEILREMDEPLKLAHTVRHLGDVHYEAGHATLAEPCYDEALVLYRSSANTRPLDLANAIRSLAVLKGDADEIEEAKRLWREARDLYVAVDVQAGVAESDARLAALAWRGRG